jgi:transcriptional regulator with XRE-family HTH domain
MATRERRQERAEWLIRRDLERAGLELRDARLQAGLTLKTVAAALGVTHPTVLRAERGTSGMDPIHLARHASVVGLRARIQLYQNGDAVKDAGQLKLIRRFRIEVGDVGAWAFEVPIPNSQDRRALDAVLTIGEKRIGFEFYTRLADLQAQLRSANLKKRDAALDRMVIVVQSTRVNRRALQVAGSTLAELFPASSRRLLDELRGGQLPPADGVIML